MSKQIEFENAADRGDYKIVFEILKNSPEIKVSTLDLSFAVDDKQTELIEIFLKQKNINPASYRNSFILTTVKNNDYKSFKLFLNDSRVNPYDNDNIIFYEAVKSKNNKILKDLLEYEGEFSHLKFANEYENKAIKKAFEDDNKEAVNLLSKDECVINTLKREAPEIFQNIIKLRIENF